MNVKLFPSKISGECFAPPSKSYAHRLLIASFLSGKKVKINGIGNSADVFATIHALKSIGGEISVENNCAILQRKSVSGKVDVYCRESGSTLRFLLPVVAGLGINGEFTGEKRLMERPLGELVDTLNSRGADIHGRTVCGKLESGRFEISANVSSQYVTGLLFALPVLDGDSELILVGDTVSKGYIDITLDVLAKFGIKIKPTDYGFFVQGNQRYTPPKEEIFVEGDFSGSAFTLCLGALSKDGVSVKGLNAESKQGDREILDVLKKFGAKVEIEKDKVTVCGEKLEAIDIDCENIPDLVQIISVVASFADGESVLRNISRLRLKESDRVQSVLDMLKVAGIDAKSDGNNIFVKGGKPKGGIFDGGNDHRTVMSSSVLALSAKGPSEIIGAQAINKSYPAFFEDLVKLGGKVSG